MPFLFENRFKQILHAGLDSWNDSILVAFSAAFDNGLGSSFGPKFRFVLDSNAAFDCLSRWGRADTPHSAQTNRCIGWGDGREKNRRGKPKVSSGCEEGPC